MHGVETGAGDGKKNLGFWGPLRKLFGNNQNGVPEFLMGESVNDGIGQGKRNIGNQFVEGDVDFQCVGVDGVDVFGQTIEDRTEAFVDFNCGDFFGGFAQKAGDLAQTGANFQNCFVRLNVGDGHNFGQDSFIDQKILALQGVRNDFKFFQKIFNFVT